MVPFMDRSDVLAAGDIAGAYLSDTVRKTDLATLNKAAGDRIVSAWTIPVGAEG